MRDLRMLPAAIAMWLVTAAIVVGWPASRVGGIALIGALVFSFAPMLDPAGLRPHAGRKPLKHWIMDELVTRAGSFLCLAGGILAATILSGIRVARAHSFSCPRELTGKLVHSVATSRGSTRVELALPGYPSVITGFTSGPVDIPPGATVSVLGTCTTNPHVGLYLDTLRVLRLEQLTPAPWYSALAQHVRTQLHAALSSLGDHTAIGIIPGIVLGDTSLISSEDMAMYRATGLSHLTAVSGANVAIVVTAVATLAHFASLGPRMKVTCCLIAMGAFAILVGTEPSVIRAVATGGIGVMSLLVHTRVEPMHALSLVVMSLLLWDSDLSVNVGFILSVSATAGIIIVSPMITPGVARIMFQIIRIFRRGRGGFRIPLVIIQAIAIALSAQLVTLPVLIALNGQVPLLAVIANLLVGAVVPWITVIGLLAALAVGFFPPLAVVLLWLTFPAAWWVNAVARATYQHPGMEVSVELSFLSVATVLIGAGWLLYFLINRQPTRCVLMLAVIVGWALLH